MGVGDGARYASLDQLIFDLWILIIINKPLLAHRSFITISLAAVDRSIYS
jgi:hypothetical protein